MPGGEKVTFIARGANLEAIRQNGFTLIEEDGTERTVSCAAAAIGEAARHDFVLLALKAHQVTAIAKDLPRLFHAGTAVVTFQNGLPWWYFHKLAGPFEGRPVAAADPDGQVAANIGAERVIGAVVYPASELIAPGVVKVVEGNRFTIGEPDGSKSERVQRLSEALTKAGFKAPISPDIRTEIWLKLWGNATFNPISALNSRHAGGHLPVPGDAGAGPSRDDRGAGDRGEGGREKPGEHRQAHHRRRGRWRAQNIHAAGRGSRAGAGAWGAGGLGDRTGAAHGDANAAPRRDLRLRAPAGENAWRAERQTPHPAGVPKRTRPP